MPRKRSKSPKSLRTKSRNRKRSKSHTKSMKHGGSMEPINDNNLRSNGIEKTITKLSSDKQEIIYRKGNKIHMRDDAPAIIIQTATEPNYKVSVANEITSDGTPFISYKEWVVNGEYKRSDNRLPTRITYYADNMIKTKEWYTGECKYGHPNKPIPRLASIRKNEDNTSAFDSTYDNDIFKEEYDKENHVISRSFAFPIYNDYKKTYEIKYVTNRIGFDGIIEPSIY
jgi:hypothetical protein